MTPFESIVRPFIGDTYDTAFPSRGKEPDASLNPTEQRMAEVLAEMYVRSVCLEDTEVQTRVRHGLATALKSLRKSAELRKKKADAVVKRAGAPLYRYRVTAPDGTEILYPKIGTIHTNRRYALLYRHVPKPTDQIEATVKRYYEYHLAKSQSEGHTAKLHAAIARDIETEITLQTEKSTSWRLADFGVRRSSLERDAQRWTSKPTDRWHYEHLVAESTPFDIDTGETPA